MEDIPEELTSTKITFPSLPKSGWPRFGSVRLPFGVGTVRAVLVFGSGGSSAEVFFLRFCRV